MGCGGSKPATRGSDYFREARTGDIVLFQSHGSMANLVRCATCSNYSHIGMIVRLRASLSATSSDVLYLWHAPSDKIERVPDMLSDPPRAKDGPQLISLRRLIHYLDHDTVVTVRKVRLPDDHPWNTEDGAVAADSPLMQWMRVEHTKIYERDRVQLARSVYDGPFGANTADTSQYFCSELQAETYKQFRVMRTRLPSNEFVPMDFADGGSANARWAKDVGFGREYEVRGPVVARSQAQRDAGMTVDDDIAAEYFMLQRMESLEDDED